MTTKLEQAARQALGSLLAFKDNFPDAWELSDEQTITSLREALAEQAEQEPVAEIVGFTSVRDALRGTKLIPNLRWNVSLWEDESPLTTGTMCLKSNQTKEYEMTKPQPVQEPVLITRLAVPQSNVQPLQESIDFSKKPKLFTNNYKEADE